jgi:hypothetical protein
LIAAEAKARLDTTLAHLCLDSRAIHDCAGNPLSEDIRSSIASGMRNDLEVISQLTSPHGQERALVL